MRGVARRLGWVPLAAAAAALSFAPAAPATPTWLAPVDISATQPASLSGFISDADVAMDPAGNAVAVWLRDEDDADEQGRGRVELATRRAGGRFGPAAPLSATVTAEEPRVAMDAAGTATVIWTELVGGFAVVHAATVVPGGSIANVKRLSTGGRHATGLALDVNAGGAAVAVWRRPDLAGNGIVESAFRAAGAVQFGDTVTPLSLAGATAFEPDVALNDAGDVVVVWRRGAIVQSRYRRFGEGFESPDNLSEPGSSANRPKVAIDPQGRATAIWWRPTADTGAAVIQSAARTRGGAFGFPPENVTDPDEERGYEPSVALDAGNTAVAVWTGELVDNPGGLVVQGAVRPSGSVFSDPQELTEPSGLAVEPYVASDLAGNAIAVWDGFDVELGHQVVQTATRPPGSGTRFGPVTRISPAGATSVDGRLAFDAEGNAAAVWRRRRGEATTVQAAGYDAASPALVSVSVPPVANSGIAAPFSAMATDRWTAVTIRWDFGDGTTATGAAVGHTYATPGSYPVVVTAADAVGNAVSAARTVQVLVPDSDGDGSDDEHDCDDANPAIRPGAPEVRGDGIDQNCDREDLPLPRIDASVQTRWGWDADKRFLFLLKLKVKGPPRGARVELRCKGERCPFERRRSTKVRKRAITLFKQLPSRKVTKARARRFRPGQRLQLRITAPAHVGKVVVYKLRRGRAPDGKLRCLPPGAARPSRC